MNEKTHPPIKILTVEISPRARALAFAFDFGHDVNRTYCTETHSYLCVNSANILRNRCLLVLAVSCGKLWIFVVSRLEVEPVAVGVA